ncbi:hypothetical protein D3C81_1810550 [compost metagenome]
MVCSALASLERGKRDAANGSQQTIHELGLAHLKADHDDRAHLIQRYVSRHVHRQGCLAHGRTAGYHDHLAALEALSELVKVGNTATQAIHHNAFLEAVQALLQDFDVLGQDVADHLALPVRAFGVEP